MNFISIDIIMSIAYLVINAPNTPYELNELNELIVSYRGGLESPTV